MSTSRTFPWAIVSVAGVAGAAFIGIYSIVRGSGPTENPDSPPSVQAPIIAQPNPAVKQNGETKPDESPTVRIVERDHKDEPHLAKQVKVERGQTQFFSAVNLSLKSSGFDRVRTLGVELKEGIAMIDLNSAAVDGLGSTGESDLLNVIGKALSQFKGVKKFKIRVDGEVLDSLGHGDISGGVTVR